MKRLLILGSMIFAATLLIHADVSTAALRSGSVSDYTTGMAAGGIGFSRHNLGSFGRVVRTETGTTEVCIFCHTPHHSTSDTGPLWNRATPVGPFTAYGMTVGGSDITTVGGPSLACLSCHDGVTTFDNLVNRPGKDLNTGDQNWEFSMPLGTPGFFGPSTVLDHFDIVSPGNCTSFCHNSEPFGVGLIGSMVIGTSLSNDHPVSVAYAGGTKASLRPASTVISTIDLAYDLSGSAASDYDGNLSQNRWAVAGFISETATINDLLRGGNVECSSCHDPHFSNKSWDEVDATWALPEVSSWCNTNEDCSDGLFLRRVGGNSGSGLCRTCHEK
jgi:hypothetical protein